MPDKPFFVYFAPGATHATHHVPPEWSARYKGRFDAGWDAVREATFARQKELGVVPGDAELSARPTEILAWDDVAEDLKPILTRQMEIYAGFLEHVDHHIGRLLDALDAVDVLDDTLIYCLVGDNGASAVRARRTARSTSSSPSTAPPPLRPPSSWPRASTTSAVRRPITTTRWDGHTP